jgi:hypothetical protein
MNRLEANRGHFPEHLSTEVPSPTQVSRTVDLDSRTPKFSPTYLIGVVLLCIGALCNEWVLRKFLSSDGVLEFETRAQIWVFDVVLILLGLFLIRFSRWTSSAIALAILGAEVPKYRGSCHGRCADVGNLLLHRGSLLFSEPCETPGPAGVKRRTLQPQRRGVGVQAFAKPANGFENAAKWPGDLQCHLFNGFLLPKSDLGNKSQESR